MVDKMHQQLIDHNKSIAASNEKLLKENTRLHAQVNHYKSEIDSFIVKTGEKVESVIRLYDKHNEKVIAFLKTAEGLTIEDVVDRVEKLFPIKLPPKQEAKNDDSRA